MQSALEDSICLDMFVYPAQYLWYWYCNNRGNLNSVALIFWSLGLQESMFVLVFILEELHTLLMAIVVLCEPLVIHSPLLNTAAAYIYTSGVVLCFRGQVCLVLVQVQVILLVSLHTPYVRYVIYIVIREGVGYLFNCREN